MRSSCETAEIVEDDGHVRKIVCLIGFGCAGDASFYMEKLTARFG
jgi:hypothetical protein